MGSHRDHYRPINAELVPALEEEIYQGIFRALTVQGGRLHEVFDTGAAARQGEGIASGCPLDRLLRLLSGEWTTHILWVLSNNGPTRFSLSANVLI